MDLRHLPGVAVSVKVTESIHPTEETLGSRFMIRCLLAVSLSASTDKHLFFVSVWAKWRLMVWHAGRSPVALVELSCRGVTTICRHCK